VGTLHSQNVKCWRMLKQQYRQLSQLSNRQTLIYIRLSLAVVRRQPVISCVMFVFSLTVDFATWTYCWCLGFSAESWSQVQRCLIHSILSTVNWRLKNCWLAADSIWQPTAVCTATNSRWQIWWNHLEWDSPQNKYIRWTKEVSTGSVWLTLHFSLMLTHSSTFATRKHGNCECIATRGNPTPCSPYPL